jgi:hypothetical protein
MAFQDDRFRGDSICGIKKTGEVGDPSDARVPACQGWNWKVVKSGVLNASRFRDFTW